MPIFSRDYANLSNSLSKKFICLLRFKEGLSLRSISRITGFAFGLNSSLGYLSRFTNTIGQKAQDKMKKLSLANATKKLQ